MPTPPHPGPAMSIQREVAADGRPWRDYLAGLILHGIKLGLDNMRFLMEAMGNPQDAVPCVHIAGTNGKGSTAAFLDAVLRAAGLRTGRFTSPHLYDITERFLVDGAPMAEEELRDGVARLMRAAAPMPHPPTFFEANTVLAFDMFQRRGVDVAVVEVGMGGRFDATNIISRPLACAVTGIDLDHQQYLGDTLQAIAFEKAGILKPGAPCVLGPLHPEAMAVVRARAGEVDAPLLLPGRDFTHECQGPPLAPMFTFKSAGTCLGPLALGLAGTHQGANAAVAAMAALRCAETFPAVTGDAVRRGLETARWPGRLEKVLDNPPVYIDGAHNPAGAAALAAAIPPSVIVFSVASDKNAGEMISMLSKKAAPLVLTVFTGGRGMELGQLEHAAGETPHLTSPNMAEAVETGMRLAGESGLPLVFAGSLYAAGEARKLLEERYGAPPLRF